MTAKPSNALDLTGVTQLPPPVHGRAFSTSRSPTRSPARKAQFAAREVDPLLKDLSPDSTLEALQETNAIRGNQAEQNALAQSISDATENERELGIRAAIAAKKLREWTAEIAGWQWPAAKDRAWGAGFIPAVDQQKSLGSLSKQQVHQYEERLDEIWDAIETLHITELKDFVFSSHQPSSRSVSGHSTAYSRLRDFTALVTATVIQSLPVLANLHLLLETWSVRLIISKQIPDLLGAMKQVLEGLNAINEILRDEVKSRMVTKQEFETAKALFGQRVVGLGKKVDNMLDLLEGQEDSLPQAWIDSLEGIEHKFADWVVQTERVVLRNEPAATSGPASFTDKTLLRSSASIKSSEATPDQVQSAMGVNTDIIQNTRSIKRKPLLEVNPRPDASHRRGVSEISVADSTLSNYSLENAEIVDAKATPLLPSPGVNVVDNPLASPQKSSWMSSKKLRESSPSRPPILERASTASIEPVYKINVREITLRKSTSHDLLSSRRSSSSTLQPGRGLVQLVPSPLASPEDEISDPIRGPAPHNILTPLAVSPSPSLRVDPLSLRGKAMIEPLVQRPIVPRRSSKRMSMPLLSNTQRPQTPPQQQEIVKPTSSRLPDPITPQKNITSVETFDDRLKTILASMPAKIRLTTTSSSGSSGTDSDSSSRASSPTHAMKLSPVRDSRTSNTLQKQSDIRVYRLKGGRPRDAPVKLYIRPVGQNGERIMVRVGGGWSDLAEYLREYSLHHGGRNLRDSKLELADYPASARSSSPALSEKQPQKQKADTGFDFGLTNSPQPSAGQDSSPWRPPPVPLIPPNMIGQAKTTSPAQEQRRSQTPVSIRSSKRHSAIVTTTPMVTTTTSSNRYTPLGGAGPVQQGRRVASGLTLNTPTNQAWVEGMVERARAASGSCTQPQRPTSTTTTTTNGNTTTIVSPTTTITTSMTTSKRTSSGTTSRRMSSWSTPSISSPVEEDPVRPSVLDSQRSSQSSNLSSLPIEMSLNTTNSEKRKSVMSLGDVSGIRRVFLRKKSDK